jgi:L,D-transpeptidase YbiS
VEPAEVEGTGLPKAGRAVLVLTVAGLMAIGLLFLPAAAGYDYRPLERAPARLAGATPSATPGTYVVIDRSNNRLWVRRRNAVVLDAVVSTGSGDVLMEIGGEGRTWTFDTPRGRFEILRERRFPVWTKPDWAFLEQGLPPPADVAQRIEKGSLGEYALDLGDGYMIHGTLYERLLGRSLTHGCVRVGRDDLRSLVAAVGPGTPVYIF